MELLEAIKAKNHDEWYLQLLSLAMEDCPDISFAIQAADLAYAEMNAPPLFPDETEIEREDEDADWREEEEPITPVGIPDASLAIHSHDDIENPRAQALLKKALGEASKLSAAGKRELQNILKVSSPTDQARRIVTFVERYRLQLADLLGGTQLASFLEGMREVARRLPIIPPRGILPTLPPSLSPEQAINLLDKMRSLHGMERAEAIYNLPPEQQNFVNRGLAIEAAVPQGPVPFTPAKIPENAPDAVVYPVIDEAAKELASKNVVTKNEYDALDDAARAKAFTVAGVDATETLAKIRDVMAEQIEKGVDVKEFQKAVRESVAEGTFLSDGHLENIFRTNVQGAFSDGQMKVLNHPFVKSGFPYATIDPIDDDRVEETHLAMETRGIQGTNYYRTDDPVFRMFRPPWRWQCRCSWTAKSIRDAANAGIKEAQEWIETGVEPSQKAFVPMPPWRPPAQFQRASLSLEISFRPMTDWMNPVIEPEKPTKKERLKKLRMKLRQKRRVNVDMKLPRSWREIKGEMSVGEESGGRWITIGSKTGSDGKHHGGSRVFVKNGKIVKGHPSLKGKKLSSLSDPIKSHWSKEAKEAGVNPQELHHLAGEFLAHDKEFKADQKRMLQEARESHRRSGFGSLIGLQARGARGKLDADAIRNLDDTAHTFANSNEWGHIFQGHEHADDRLFDLLMAGNPKLMSADEAYRQALDYLYSEKKNKNDDKDTEFDPDNFDADFSVRHAPKGGITVAGHPFAGGEFIPDDVMAKASPEEKAAIEGTEAKEESQTGKINKEDIKRHWKESLAIMKNFSRPGWDPAKRSAGGSPQIKMAGGMLSIYPETFYESGEGYKYGDRYRVFQSIDGGVRGKVIDKTFDSIEEAADFSEARLKMLVDQNFKRKPEEGSPLYEIYKRAERRALKDVGPIDPEKPRLPDGREIPSGQMPCVKCGGYGVIPTFGHVAEGICFKCGGSGLLKAPKSKPAIPPSEMSVRHAPPGEGVNLAGKHFKPGQFIPDTSWNKATPEERAQVEGKTSEKPLSTQEEIPQTIQELHGRADKSAVETIEKTAGIFEKIGKAGTFIKQKTKAVYNALEKRYGRKTAIAIFAAGHVVGLATPAVILPGSTILGMVPFAAMAEVYLQAKRGLDKLSGAKMSEEQDGLTMEEVLKLGKELAETLMNEWAEYVKSHGVKEE